MFWQMKEKLLLEMECVWEHSSIRFISPRIISNVCVCDVMCVRRLQIRRISMLLLEGICDGVFVDCIF